MEAAADAFKSEASPTSDRDELYKVIAELTDEFNQLHDDTWKVLMENEMHLHESVNESNATFEHVIQDMMNEFMEQCKTQFVQIRDVEGTSSTR